MNTTLQKRIEEAAEKICCTDCPFESIRNCKGCVERKSAIETANIALQNQWVSVDEALPERNRNVLALKLDGDVIVAFHDGMETWWWCDGFICGEKINGDKKYSSCCEIASISHWMPIPELKGGEE